VIKCGECGKTFHEKCAARIEKCPNCDAKLDMSEIEEE
jgi:DNA-directed RNA polymerase subunit RPC12/RpoP